VLATIAADPFASGDDPGSIAGGLRFDHAAGGQSSVKKTDVGIRLNLFVREEAVVGQAGPAILQVDDAVDARLQRLAEGVQQISTAPDSMTSRQRPARRSE